uniref:Reverse transcriptase domain-containing protein n=1 Tax=Trichobilharzia regenti TaxID=157069 RepID=A0AA85JP77_TRIRE|nr:unnamed protein product [Trichobilharzia regenti]
MNRTDYEKKAIEHLSEGPYLLINEKKKSAKFNKMKRNINRLFQEMKPKIGNSLWLTLKPNSHISSRFYGQPKIHKPTVPLRPEIDFTNSPTYNLSKYLLSILQPPQKDTQNIVRNSYDFKSQIEHREIDKEDIMVSYDINSLYTSVPSLDNISGLLESDTTLTQRCPLDGHQ